LQPSVVEDVGALSGGESARAQPAGMVRLAGVIADRRSGRLPGRPGAAGFVQHAGRDDGRDADGGMHRDRTSGNRAGSTAAEATTVVCGGV